MCSLQEVEEAIEVILPLHVQKLRTEAKILSKKIGFEVQDYLKCICPHFSYYCEDRDMSRASLQFKNSRP